MKIMTFIMVGCIAGGVQAASVLFEDFEQSNSVTAGSLDGQNNWSVDSGAGVVQTLVVQSGSQALEIIRGSVSKGISTNGSALWMHFQVRITEVPQLVPEVDPINSSVAFYVNTNRNLVALSNGVPVELAAQMPLDTWTRFDVYCDSVAGIWNLAMNGINVASGLGQASSGGTDQIAFENRSAAGAFVDSLDVSDFEQVGEEPDSDSDGIPDWWEQKYFGGATDCVAGAASGNGDFTYKETYIAAVDPHADEPFLMDWDNGTVMWTPKPSRMHDVEWAPSLFSNFVVIASDVAWPGDQYFDAAHTNESSGFYRVRIHL